MVLKLKKKKIKFGSDSSNSDSETDSTSDSDPPNNEDPNQCANKIRFPADHDKALCFVDRGVLVIRDKSPPKVLLVLMEI